MVTKRKVRGLVEGRMAKCRHADAYKGIHPPTCGGKRGPCQMCLLKWERAKRQRAATAKVRNAMEPPPVIVVDVAAMKRGQSPAYPGYGKPRHQDPAPAFNGAYGEPNWIGANAMPILALTLQAKLGSFLVHAEEGLSAGGHEFDFVALRQLMVDPEVVEWMNILRLKGFLPVKRAVHQERLMLVSGRHSARGT